MGSTPAAADPMIEVHGLAKTYNRRTRALDGLSLSVAPGTIYGLLGPNGAGKTTLIRVLATLLPPDSGTALVAGCDVRTDPARVRARIGLAGQYAAVDELLTGYENVEMVGRLYGLPARIARRRAREVLERIGLTGAATRPVRTYSGGMRRRLDLAASLVGQPEVLFLDEPTAGLDPASRAELWALIRDLVAPTSGTTSALPRVRVRRTLSDVAVLTRRNLLHTVRLPEVLATSAIMPAVFILMFTYVFGGAVGTTLPPAAAGKYVNWLIPGLLAQFALFGGGGTASGLVEDLNKGVIDRFRSLPMARSAVLAGRTASDLLRSTLILTLMLAVGTAIGFRVQTSLAGLVAAVGIALAFGYAWSWAMAVIALSVRTAEAVQAAVYMGVFPLAFTSSVFVPTQTMPTWLQPFAANQPITVVTNALRGLILGPGAPPPGQTVTGQVLLALAWSAAITAVFAPLAVRAYRRAVR